MIFNNHPNEHAAKEGDTDFLLEFKVLAVGVFSFILFIDIFNTLYSAYNMLGDLQKKTNIGFI